MIWHNIVFTIKQLWHDFHLNFKNVHCNFSRCNFWMALIVINLIVHTFKKSVCVINSKAWLSIKIMFVHSYLQFHAFWPRNLGAFVLRPTTSRLISQDIHLPCDRFYHTLCQLNNGSFKRWYRNTIATRQFMFENPWTSIHMNYSSCI